MAEHNTPGQQLNASLRGTHYHAKRKFLCRTPVITISRTISTADAQLKEREEANSVEKSRELGHLYRYITTLEVLVDFGLWRRGLKVVMGSSMRACPTDLDFRLSTYHIVDENALVFQAAKAFDIATVRTLFASGHASPFDQNTRGQSLFDWVFCRLCHSRDTDEAIRGLEMLKFIFKCGGAPMSLTDQVQAGGFP